MNFQAGRGFRAFWHYLGLIALLATASPSAQAQGSDPVVIMQTTKGNLAIRVFYSVVPTTAGNFLDLVSKGFYNGLSFHRVENWCIQGGDPNGNGSGSYIDPGTGRPRYIRLETNRNLRHNAAGVVAMARSSDPNSASCQFYILKGPMPQLDGKYAVFGMVARGLDTIYRIRPGDRIVSAEIYNPNPPQQQAEGMPQQQQQPAQSTQASGGGSGRTDSGF